jgi:hypothetical protein
MPVRGYKAAFHPVKRLFFMNPVHPKIRVYQDWQLVTRCEKSGSFQPFVISSRFLSWDLPLQPNSGILQSETYFFIKGAGVDIVVVYRQSHMSDFAFNK